MLHQRFFISRSRKRHPRRLHEEEEEEEAGAGTMLKTVEFKRLPSVSFYHKLQTQWAIGRINLLALVSVHVWY
jgi:hypothetical protein